MHHAAGLGELQSPCASCLQGSQIQTEEVKQNKHNHKVKWSHTLNYLESGTIRTWRRVCYT